jgi:hypothetical protein
MSLELRAKNATFPHQPGVGLEWDLLVYYKCAFQREAERLTGIICDAGSSPQLPLLSLNRMQARHLHEQGQASGSTVATCFSTSKTT